MRTLVAGDLVARWPKGTRFVEERTEIRFLTD
jgi:hypothetical protein